MIIVSGPSTVGKNPFIYKVCGKYSLEYHVPYTTREIRADEKDGKDYHFISKCEFQSYIQSDKINEWDYCLDNYYGYMFPFCNCKGVITHGLSRMAIRIKKKYPNNIKTVFLMPDNIDRIYANVEKIYKGKELVLRKALVEEELLHSTLFDIVVKVKDSIDELFTNDSIISLLHSEFKNNLE